MGLACLFSVYHGLPHDGLEILSVDVRWGLHSLSYFYLHFVPGELSGEVEEEGLPSSCNICHPLYPVTWGEDRHWVSLKSFEPKWQLHLCPDASRAGLSIIRSPSLPLGCAHLSSWIFGGDWPCSAPSASWCCSDSKTGQSLVQIQGRGVSVVLAVGTLSGPDLLLGGFSLNKQKRFKASAVGAE